MFARRPRWRIGLWVLLALAVPAVAQSGDWYVPMSDQVDGGFDHIQVLTVDPFQFDTLALSNFFGLDADYNLVPQAEQWGQMYIDDTRSFASATGPNLGDDLLVFDIWVAGERATDRVIFHYQTYRDDEQVGNWDIRCTGPGELDWVVESGTWSLDQPFLYWLPGDADLDGDVDLDDFVILKRHFGIGGTWGEGDFDGDSDVDLDDFVILKNNFGLHTVPEPATVTLLAIGAAVLGRRRRAA
ncbi:MAG: PEP-CTERM sorting domain-containing protein [Planctomycetota bacterium]